MLKTLLVRNLATIEKIELEFTSGLIVLTGETGAGKSIIIDALNFLLGARGDIQMIRSGTDNIIVEGIFEINPETYPTFVNYLHETELDEFNNEITVSRQMNKMNKNICRLNGNIVPLKVLAEIGSILVDIHGQGQHISLNQSKSHINILDRYAGLNYLTTQYIGLVNELKETRYQLETLQSEKLDKIRKKDFLEYQISEISTAQLVKGEDSELEQELLITNNSEKIQNTLQKSIEKLFGDETESAKDKLAIVYEGLKQIESLDPIIENLRKTSESIMYQIEDLVTDFRNYSQTIDFDASRLGELQGRIDQINQLKRKYGNTIDEIINHELNSLSELHQINDTDKQIAGLNIAVNKLLNDTGDIAAILSVKRHEASNTLVEKIHKELTELAMPNTQLSVSFQHKLTPDGLPVSLDGSRKQLVDFDKSGVDKVEFLATTNPGEDMKSLAKIVSGGETARFMLAIKVILSDAVNVPTLIFDEIDSGIGGRIGSVVGEKLWKLGNQYQVLCVTHLPQIASFADQHILVGKTVLEGKTSTWASTLDGKSRIQELSHMLGFTDKASLSHAQEMFGETIKIKQSNIA